MESNYVIIGGVTVVITAILVYVVLMIFLPEWVGITGKTALNYERSHAEENPKTASTEATPSDIATTDASSTDATHVKEP